MKKIFRMAFAALLLAAVTSGSLRAMPPSPASTA